MNERIRELAKKAGLSHMASNYSDMADLYKGADFELEKFAQLIVLECIEVCNSRVGNSDYNTGRMHCALDLKEHFGVER